MSLFFRPGRQLRRAQSGRPCPGCGLTVHHADLVMYAAPTQTYFLHEACASMLAENAAAAQAEEDAQAAALPRAEAQQGDQSSVTDREETL